MYHFFALDFPLTFSKDLGYLIRLFMGRYNTGAVTTGQCLQVSIKAFTKHIKEGTNFLVGSMNWDSGGSITVKLLKENNRYFVELDYIKTIDGEKKNIQYKVLVCTVPSNLGKGEVYYFLCPFSHKRCKVLYMAYGSLYFKSRVAYRHRIYFASQMSSRLDKHNDAYWRLERKLELLYPKHPKTHYKGEETAPGRRIKRLEKTMNYHEAMRWRVLPVSIMKSMVLQGVTDASQLF
jgi:hypothetical protein